MNVPLAYQNRSLEPEDINCASSAPNALMGARFNPSIWPRIGLSPSLSQTPKVKSFQLLSLFVKPVGAAPLYLSIIFQGWVIEHGRAVDYASASLTYLTAGHHGPLKLELYKPWVNWRKNFTVVEMWAQTQEGEDWPFCVDDLVVGLVEE